MVGNRVAQLASPDRSTHKNRGTTELGPRSAGCFTPAVPPPTSAGVGRTSIKQSINQQVTINKTNKQASSIKLADSVQYAWSSHATCFARGMIPHDQQATLQEAETADASAGLRLQARGLA